MTSPILPTEQRENEIEMWEEEEEEEGKQGEEGEEEEGRKKGVRSKGGVVVQHTNFISGLSTLLLKEKSGG